MRSSARPRRFFRRFRVRTVQICGRNRMLLVTNASADLPLSSANLSTAVRVQNLSMLKRARARAKNLQYSSKRLFIPRYLCALRYFLFFLQVQWKCINNSLYRLFRRCAFWHFAAGQIYGIRNNTRLHFFLSSFFGENDRTVYCYSILSIYTVSCYCIPWRSCAIHPGIKALPFV